MELSDNSFHVSKVHSIMANGNMVAASMHFEAKRQGRTLSMDGIDAMRIDDGRIKEIWLFSSDQAGEDAFWK